jgi:hypothetical protein
VLLQMEARQPRPLLPGALSKIPPEGSIKWIGGEQTIP